MSSPPQFHEPVIRDSQSGRWLIFRNPLEIIVARTPEEVLPALRRVEACVVEQKKHAAGWLAYEAASAFDRALITKPCLTFPLLWFGIYASPQVTSISLFPHQEPTLQLDWQATLAENEYEEALSRIKEAIAAGDTYQTNFTFRLRASFNADAWQYFLRLNRLRPATYAAFLETEEWAICSASPELFFQLEGETLICKPMKGTAARGRTCEEDSLQAEWLKHSEKNRAENLMIVDMVRNDLGRIAEVGSVTVPQLFEVEKYFTLWQMTSTVQARTQAGLCELMRALFPPASITGAPKASTMSLIETLESSPRKLYTGAIGFFAPDRRAQFNVAIRTVLIDKKNNEAEYGVGSGIVWDSDTQVEFDECRTKTAVLNRQPPEFCLLETMLWTPAEGFFLLDLHLARLRRSANYFDFRMPEDSIRERLDRFVAGLNSPSRVRLTMDEEGRVSCETNWQGDISLLPAPKVCLAKRAIDSSDRFLYHKTTYREVYKTILAEHADCDDVILWNERGEATESCFANLVVELDGDLFTPPIHCGLLAGVYRQWRLEQGQIKERVIPIAELQTASRLYLINSVRKQQPIALIDKK